MQKNDVFDLTGRVAIITGGAGLLAYEHAVALIGNGARVVLADIKETKCEKNCHALKQSGYQDVIATKCDVTDKNSWTMLLNRALEAFGRIDILINNAGFTNQSMTKGYQADFEYFTLEDWKAIMDVNLTGVFLGCQAIGSYMLKQGKGSIINIASLYGVVSPLHPIYKDTGISQPVAYSVSKHGVVALTKYIAALWAGRGVRVNALTPGGIFDGQNDLFVDRFSKLNPIGRMSRKEEIRGGILFLASDASSHVVGHNLVIDGGWTIW